MCENGKTEKKGDIEAKNGVFAGGLPASGIIRRGFNNCVKWLKRVVLMRSVREADPPKMDDILKWFNETR